MSKGKHVPGYVDWQAYRDEDDEDFEAASNRKARQPSIRRQHKCRNSTLHFR